MIIITIPGKPMGKQRPRVMKNGITYTPKETVSYENLVKMCYMQRYGNENIITGPLKMKIRAYFEIPKGTSKRRAELMRADVERPIKKPDVDNIVKIICDALNKVAYKDDAQIVSCEVHKYYSDTQGLKLR
ncbi:RusA family crossover junction endodeoxyribonuclease [Caloramator sp. Dgby_cultured_2]|uniref:RusA family crossover junction endodeoxyribonuclease n=1 Tax=Caloramator sp. Dgby_cultured_2 TaxID=3029174 RepID=UPI00237DAC4A|nr:RusA family crossover junction endodeoxyribonuclease [Caloramator sp. Dgby_cultured_2]WDU84224.1 RusA family crossover junction endodeoxyribonuclease [Caloramator sp. Dgby_cultured_2]